MNGATDHATHARDRRIKRRILLVEDAPSHPALRERLVTLGYVVFATTSGLDTFHVLESVRMDGIVLDLDIRMLDAIVLLKEIRRHHRNVPIIVMSSSCDLHGLLGAIRCGATDYLVKPVDEDLLRQKCLRVF